MRIGALSLLIVQTSSPLDMECCKYSEIGQLANREGATQTCKVT